MNTYINLIAWTVISMLLSGIGCKPEEAIPVELKEICPETTQMTLAPGQTATITCRLIPAEAAPHTTLTWATTDSAVAQVTQDGLVTAVSPGSADITISSGDIRASVHITVTEIQAESITVDPASATLAPGQEITLTATILPEDATDRLITWSTDGTGVIQITPDCDRLTVKALASGKATVTATSGQASATCSITCEDPLRIGDFLYLDGTTSHELESGKTLVGIVFWTGDPGKDDPALRKDHPECTNGLAVCIKGDIQTAWQSNITNDNGIAGKWIEENAPEYLTITTDLSGDEPDLLNKILGYNNTKALEVYNRAPENQEWTITVIEAIQDYSAKNPAPENTSGWYLPSIKEMSLMTTGEYDGNIGEINGEEHPEVYEQLYDIMKDIPGAETIDSAAYWSSSENTIGNILVIGIYGGYVDQRAKNTKFLYCRPVLAF